MREPERPVYIEPTIRVEACVCGGSIVVYGQGDKGIRQAVSAHNGSLSHTLWRRWVEA